MADQGQFTAPLISIKYFTSGQKTKHPLSLFRPCYVSHISIYLLHVSFITTILSPFLDHFLESKCLPRRRSRNAYTTPGGTSLWPFCHKLAREAVEAPALEAFMAKCEGVLGSMTQWVAILLMVGGLELDDH